MVSTAHKSRDLKDLCHLNYAGVFRWRAVYIMVEIGTDQRCVIYAIHMITAIRIACSSQPAYLLALPPSKHNLRRLMRQPIGFDPKICRPNSLGFELDIVRHHNVRQHHLHLCRGEKPPGTRPTTVSPREEVRSRSDYLALHATIFLVRVRESEPVKGAGAVVVRCIVMGRQ